MLFAPPANGRRGLIYEYEDVPKEDVEKMMEGSEAAKTYGETIYGMWFTGKDPSIGAAFNTSIKKKNYEYKVIADDDIKDDQLLKVRGTDTVHKAIQYVDAFKELTIKGNRTTKAKAMKFADESLKELPDELIANVIAAIDKEMAKEVEEAASQGKKKKFEGGKGPYREKRIKEEVEKLKKKPTGTT